MVMQYSEGELRKLGDSDLAGFVADVRKIFKGRHPGLEDIDLPPTETSVALRPGAESQPILPSLDKLVVIAIPVPEIARTWKAKGIANFDFFRLLPYQFDGNGDDIGWIKPGPWFWDSIKQGQISFNAAKVEEMLVAIDNIQKPNYERGRQRYEEDPFADLLRQLRRKRKITVPKGHRYIPKTSRFGISPDEITQHVFPTMAEMLEVNKDKVRLPTLMELNIIGNRFHREWGDTNTWEWTQDQLGGDQRLYAGNSNEGGFASARSHWADSKSDGVGFRPLVVLSSQT